MELALANAELRRDVCDARRRTGKPAGGSEYEPIRLDTAPRHGGG
jgi:hypothetical protein